MYIDQKSLTARTEGINRHRETGKDWCRSREKLRKLMYDFCQDKRHTIHARTGHILNENSHALQKHFTSQGGVETTGLYDKFLMRSAIILMSTCGGDLDRLAWPQIELTLITFTAL